MPAFWISHSQAMRGAAPRPTAPSTGAKVRRMSGSRSWFLSLGEQHRCAPGSRLTSRQSGVICAWINLHSMWRVIPLFRAAPVLGLCCIVAPGQEASWLPHAPVGPIVFVAATSS